MVTLSDGSMNVRCIWSAGDFDEEWGGDENSRVRCRAG